MNLVVDTNVLVSGLLNVYGAPGMLVRLIAEGEFPLSFDPRILHEYAQVLKRKKFGFDEDLVDDFLDQIQIAGSMVTAKPLPTSLPDKDDNPFLEVALAAQADYLVTGNIKHFPPNHCFGMKVVTPKQFFDQIRGM